VAFLFLENLLISVADGKDQSVMKTAIKKEKLVIFMTAKRAYRNS
jgi:hypothetical protein